MIRENMKPYFEFQFSGFLMIAMFTNIFLSIENQRQSFTSIDYEEIDTRWSNYFDDGSWYS